MTEQPILVRAGRRFAAPPERVFDAWLSPAMIGRFIFDPQLREEEIVRLSLDARVGGAFSFVVRRSGEEVDHIGRYLEIERPRRLVFTWAVAPEPEDSSRVVIEIAPLASGCDLTLTHAMQPKWAEFAPRVEQGWTTMLGALGQALDGP
jgi:uncharacterized protein YndB with AHSA1/START domain